MTRRFASACVVAILLAATAGCTKKAPAQQLVVEIPAGFSGNFVLNMGMRDATPLSKQGETYFLSVPASGNAQTSTFLENPRVEFKNASNGKIWGYSQRMFTTGDGISVGGKIEFFVGTQQEFEAEKNRKNKSGGYSKPELESYRA